MCTSQDVSLFLVMLRWCAATEMCEGAAVGNPCHQKTGNGVCTRGGVCECKSGFSGVDCGTSESVVVCMSAISVCRFIHPLVLLQA